MKTDQLQKSPILVTCVSLVDILTLSQILLYKCGKCFQQILITCPNYMPFLIFLSSYFVFKLQKTEMRQNQHGNVKTSYSTSDSCGTIPKYPLQTHWNYSHGLNMAATLK